MKAMTNNRPCFSVVIDNYNYGCFVEDAIDSVLNQRFPSEEVEIIVVDDGSTDDSFERVRQYGDRVVYIYKENGGQASAFNVGIARARGEFIALLDADDYWHPTKLREVFSELRRSETTDFVYHFMNVIGSARTVIDRYIFPPPLPIREGGARERYVDRYLGGRLPWFAPASGMTVRAECLKRAVPIPGDFRIWADLYLHYILPFYIRDLSLIRKPLGYYRLHEKNLSGGNRLTLEKINRESDILKLIETHVESHARKLGYDSVAIIKRMESVLVSYKIVGNILRGKRRDALRDVLSFHAFLPSDSNWYRFFRKSTLLMYIVLPPPFWLWLQRRYRSVVYSIGNLASPGGRE